LVCPSKVPRQTGRTGQDRPAGCRPTGAIVSAGELTGITCRTGRRGDAGSHPGALPGGQAQHRARQQLKMYLLRHNLRYGGQTAWVSGASAFTWPRSKCPLRSSRLCFRRCSTSSPKATGRLERYDQEIERRCRAGGEPVVRALMSLRGWRCSMPPRWWPNWRFPSLRPSRPVDELLGLVPANTPREPTASRRHQPDGQRAGRPPWSKPPGNIALGAA